LILTAEDRRRGT